MLSFTAPVLDRRRLTRKVFSIFRGLPEPFRNLLEAHYRALREYVPTAYPGRVTLFRARTRPLLRLHGRDLGWSRLAAGGLEIIEITGNHDSILSEPHVRVLAQRLRFCLEKAQATNEQRTNHR